MLENQPNVHPLFRSLALAETNNPWRRAAFMFRSAPLHWVDNLAADAHEYFRNPSAANASRFGQTFACGATVSALRVAAGIGLTAGITALATGSESAATAQLTDKDKWLSSALHELAGHIPVVGETFEGITAALGSDNHSMRESQSPLDVAPNAIGKVIHSMRQANNEDQPHATDKQKAENQTHRERAMVYALATGMKAANVLGVPTGTPGQAALSYLYEQTQGRNELYAKYNQALDKGQTDEADRLSDLLKNHGATDFTIANSRQRHMKLPPLKQLRAPKEG
jgi:hypothetical protein